MQIELTDHSPVRKTMAIEVAAEEVERETQEVLRDYRRRSRLPGFRQGKAPLDLIRKRYSKEVHEDVRDRMVSRLFRAAVEQKGLRPLGDPVVDELSFEEGRPFRFKTTFEVLPPLQVRSYRDVEVERPAVRLGDDEVERALEELRQSRARLVVEEGRVAAAGDVVIADVTGTPDGGEGEPFRKERVEIQVGARGNLEAYNEGLSGARSGDQRTFRVEYPADYPSAELAGRAYAVEARVHEVKARQVPDLDDEFAKDLGEFDDLAALRTRIREDLQRRKEHEEERARRQAVLDQVLLQNPVVLPDVLVEHEVRDRLEELVRGMILQGLDPEKLEVDWSEVRKRQEEPARKSVHARIVLDAVAEREAITVDQRDVDARIRREAQRAGQSADELRRRLREGHRLEALRTQLVREKTLDYLTSVANIRTSG